MPAASPVPEPSATDLKPRPTVGQKLAIGIGAVVTVGLVLSVVAYSANQLWQTKADLRMIGLAAYLIGMVSHFWAARLYESGMTLREFLLAGLWPVELVRNVRAAARGPRSRAASSSDRPLPKRDYQPLILSQADAELIGGSATIITGVIAVIALLAALVAPMVLVWLLAFYWTSGMMVHFWLAAVWRGGLTATDMRRSLVWQASMQRLIRAGSHYRRFGK